MLLVHTGVVTVISTIEPVVPAGEIAVIWVELLIIKLVAGVPPKFTLVVSIKFVPVMITDVPPAGIPAVGLIAVMVGTSS